jgi:response regulator NasT
MSDAEITLSILIIDENRLRAAVIEDGLRDAGYTKLTIVHDVAGIARRIADLSPDVIVIDLENPNRDVLESMFQLSRVVKRPIAMFVDRSDQAAIEAAVDAGVSAYVVDGLKRERVKPILDMAVSRFNAFARMSRELEEARSQLESRKLVDRAKGILMKTRGLSEADAYGLLRKTAMNQNRKISEIAESLITAAGLLAPPFIRDCRRLHAPA